MLVCSRYVPANEGFYLESPLGKQVQWYKTRPNRQSLGSSQGVSVAPLRVGETVSYRVESQIRKKEFTFDIIGVASYGSKASTVYGVLGFPLSVDISPDIEQVYRRMDGVLTVVPEDMWTSNSLSLSFLINSNSGHYCFIHKVSLISSTRAVLGVHSEQIITTSNPSLLLIPTYSLPRSARSTSTRIS